MNGIEGLLPKFKKSFSKLFSLVELFKTSRVSLCTTPSQRVWSDSMHRCLCDSLYIGRYKAIISILAQKPPRIDFFQIFAKLWKEREKWISVVSGRLGYGIRSIFSEVYEKIINFSIWQFWRPNSYAVAYSRDGKNPIRVIWAVLGGYYRNSKNHFPSFAPHWAL